MADDVPAPPAADRWRLGVVAAAVIGGMGALAWSLAVEPGSSDFYAATSVLGIVWFTGAMVAGPGPSGRADVGLPVRRVAEPLGLGLALAALFVIGALLVRQVDVLAEAVDDVVDYARRGSSPLVLALTVGTGVAEELLFRGALFETWPRRHAAAASTLVYVAATCASGRVALVFAAVVLGTVLALQRERTGGFTAPAITHVTWAVAMVVLLPLIVNVDAR